MYFETHYRPVALLPNKPTNELEMIQFIMSGGVRPQYGEATTPKFLTHRKPMSERPPVPLALAQQVELQMNYLTQFFETTKFLENKANFYRQFKIPKRKGGFRTITAPCESLKQMQSLQKMFIEDTLKVLPHNASHAYTKQRGIKTNAEVHQDSRYFLNIDMKDFFPSHSPEFVKQQLLKITPLLYFPEYVTLLIELAEFEGGLPQGTPLSPLLTNLCCVELDYNLTTKLYHYYNQRTDHKAMIHYTRYADDCTFSSVHHFKAHEVVELVKEVLEDSHYPYTIHPEKTKFTTHKGKNRVTGLKINAENQITVGYEEKRKLKSDIHNVLRDIEEQNYPKKEVITQLVGWLAFLHDIEPGYYQFLCNKYAHSNSLIDTLSQILRKY